MAGVQERKSSGVKILAAPIQHVLIINTTDVVSATEFVCVLNAKRERSKPPATAPNLENHGT